MNSHLRLAFSARDLQGGDEMSHTTALYRADDLRDFARALIERAGVRSDIARDVADVLLDGDLLGHTTHGLALLAPYLGELADGKMAKSGEPTILAERPATQI